MSGTLPADTLVLEKDAQEGVDAGFFFSHPSRRVPFRVSSRAFPFRGAAAVEKTKIQVGDTGDPMINIVSRYCTYAGRLISFHFGYDISYRTFFSVFLFLVHTFRIVFGKSLYFQRGSAMVFK